MLHLLVGVLSVILVVLIVIYVVRGRSPRTNATADGFWITTEGLRQGTRIRYSCLVGRSRHQGQLLVEAGPGRMFVYTGSTPSDINVDVESFSGNSYDDSSYSSDDDDVSIGSGEGAGTYFPTPDGSDGGSYDGSSDTGSGMAGESSASNAGDGYPPAY